MRRLTPDVLQLEQKYNDLTIQEEQQHSNHTEELAIRQQQALRAYDLQITELEEKNSELDFKVQTVPGQGLLAACNTSLVL